nr:uncharacterized protein LOC127330585 [Lolium perenne]
MEVRAVGAGEVRGWRRSLRRRGTLPSTAAPPSSKEALPSCLPGSSVGFAGNSWAEGGVWTQTGEVYCSGAKMRPTATCSRSESAAENQVRSNYKEEVCEKAS